MLMQVGDLQFSLEEARAYQPDSIDCAISNSSISGLALVALNNDVDMYVWPNDLTIEGAVRSLPDLAKKITQYYHLYLEEVLLLLSRLSITVRPNHAIVFVKENRRFIILYEREATLFGLEISGQDLVSMFTESSRKAMADGFELNECVYSIHGEMLTNTREEAMAYTTIVNQQLMQSALVEYEKFQAMYNDGPRLDPMLEARFFHATDKDPDVGHG